jgi:hypothetical protein
MVEKIISGGQSGVDQGALDFALAKNVNAGGWCPKGRIYEYGVIPDRYPLTEVQEDGYHIRTLRNVRDADGTLVIIRNGFQEKGTALTIDYCRQLEKPYFLIDTNPFSEIGEAIKDEFAKWLLEYSIKVLNVAGNRESNCPGIQKDTYGILEYLLIL